jgi:tetratricopeptide (TPR) repeat protein
VGDRIKQVSFKKTDGQTIDAFGVHGYKVLYEAELEFEVDASWIPGWAMDPRLSFQLETNLNAGGVIVHRGDHIKIAGSMGGEQWESGWKFTYGGGENHIIPNSHTASGPLPGLPPARTSKEYNVQSLMKYQNNDFAGAISDCTKAIELDPTNSLAYLYRGHAKRGLKDYEGAMADYMKCFALNNRSPLTYWTVVRFPPKSKFPHVIFPIPNGPV